MPLRPATAPTGLPRRLRVPPAAWPLRWHLALLSLVLVLPILAAAAAAAVAWTGAEHRRLEEQARIQARHLVQDVDARVQATFVLLQAVASALHAARDADPAAPARVLAAARREAGVALSLHEENGAPPPVSASEAGGDGDDPCPAAAATVVPVGPSPEISGLLACAAAPGAPPGTPRRFFVRAAVAVAGGGALSLRMPVEELRTALLAPPWLGGEQGPALVDRDGVVLARWRGHDGLVGRPMPPDALAALRAAPEGLWRGRNLEGRTVLVAHATSALTGWAVGVGVTSETLTAPRRSAALAFGPAAAGLAALAVGGTLLLARRIERPIAALAGSAAALGRDEAPPASAAPPGGGGRIAEVEAVAAALHAAGRALREAEAARRLMLLEMQHRVKNALATAQSVAALTARGATDPQAFARGFGARLRAIAETHALVMQGGGAAAPLRPLLARELAPYAAAAPGRVDLSGPDVTLPAEAALAVGMVAHELATNAAKHGALSREEGRVAVAWSVAPEGPGRRLSVEWTESGGPPVAAAPGRRGFGSRLMEQALGGALRGGVALDWRPEGLRARLELALPSAPG